MPQVIISPAKQMRVARDSFAPRGIPPFPRQTEQLWRELLQVERTQGREGLRKLWNVNEKLLAQNIELLGRFEPVRDEAALDDPAIAPLVSPVIMWQAAAHFHPSVTFFVNHTTAARKIQTPRAGIYFFPRPLDNGGGSGILESTIKQSFNYCL